MPPAIPTNPPAAALLPLDPVPTLLSRLRAELAAEFDFARPIRISRAPGRLDVMGGIADYTGAIVCELPLDRAAAVALQSRADRQLQIFSFNLLDDNKPFTFRMPIDALAMSSAQSLRQDFNQPGRHWVAYIAGCLFVLHEQGFINLSDPAVGGLNLAIFSTVPLGAGISSSAAIVVATMMNLRDHFALMKPSAGRSLRIVDDTAFSAMKLAELCQLAENQIAGAACGIMDPATSCLGEAGSLFRMICQPHEVLPPLQIPQGVQFLGINSHVKHSVAASAYTATRCAAFMAHKIILEKMRQIGAAGGKRLIRDPMAGYLANLDPDHYKRIFRPSLPEQITGRAFIDQFTGTIDTATQVDPGATYGIVHAADHHVLEARRVKNFVLFLEEAMAATDPAKRGFALDKAGHLMYASHQSYSHDAMLGAAECDLLVKLLRAREPAGLYGARITGGGAGGTVAVLADQTDRANEAINEAMRDYEKQTSLKPQLFSGSSAGAWHTGTAVVGP
ncbi:MAG TPA: hypothetical protein VFE47_28600 [Tepidisphaeraceae bacterium]|jgi:L-arabinokinase|nr:hypothetical protein [Tepidisphaeraceae bacterium]